MLSVSESVSESFRVLNVREREGEKNGECRKQLTFLVRSEVLAVPLDKEKIKQQQLVGEAIRSQGI